MNVLIVDDHAVVRNGIKYLLEKEADIDVVGECASGSEVMRELADKQVDLVITDINLPQIDGIKLTGLIKGKYPDLPVLVVSMYARKFTIKSILNAGALGYVSKTASPEEMILGVRKVGSGEPYISGDISRLMISGAPVSDRSRARSSPEVIDSLSPRELEVLKLIVDGHSNAEIATHLILSVRTVDSHRRNIMQKLGSRNAAELVKSAILGGLFDLENQPA